MALHGCTCCPICSRCTICGCDHFKQKIDLVTTDSELQHLKHKYKGYQAFVRGDCNPFSINSARAESWDEGWFEAQQDFEEYHPNE